MQPVSQVHWFFVFFFFILFQSDFTEEPLILLQNKLTIKQSADGERKRG